MPETDNDLIGDTDALHWARRFVIVHRNLLTGPERRDIGEDEETMTTWFAAAIESGRMAGESTAVHPKPADGGLMTPELAAAEAVSELRDAMAKFGPMASAHEGYAVILEELDELWDEIKSKTGTKQTQYDEAKQVAAMALRFMIDVCPPAASCEHRP